MSTVSTFILPGARANFSHCHS